MLRTISDNLFMGSLILLMIAVVVSGIGFQFFAPWRELKDAENGVQGESVPRKKIVIDGQDKSLRRFVRSKLLLIALAGLLLSIVLSYMAG